MEHSKGFLYTSLSLLQDSFRFKSQCLFKVSAAETLSAAIPDYRIMAIEVVFCISEFDCAQPMQPCDETIILWYGPLVLWAKACFSEEKNSQQIFS